jgi:hypothetical protein
MSENICHSLPPGGLGDAICALSVLMATGLPVQITETDPFLGTSLKEIFQIPDQRLTVKQVPEMHSPDTWLSIKSKLFVPYFACHRVKVFGQQFQIDRNTRKKRPCVALAAYSDQYMADQLESHRRVDFPFNRIYDRTTWQRIYEYFSKLNYDIISLNSPKISLDQKVWVLNELCDAVICAEGGIAHLAHLLQIPTFILPWHHWIDGSHSPYEIYAAHNFHVDPRTWFLQDADELLSWDHTQFNHNVDALYHDQGNNAYLQGLLKIDTENLCTLAPLHTWLDTMISDQEKAFLRKYVTKVA